MENPQTVDTGLARGVEVLMFLFIIYAYGNPRAVAHHPEQGPSPRDQVPADAPPDILVSALRVLDGLRKIAKQNIQSQQTQATPIEDVDVADYVRELEAKIRA
jgi:hypothetical protein